MLSHNEAASPQGRRITISGAYPGMPPLSERVQAPTTLLPGKEGGLHWRGMRRSDLHALLELERAANLVDSPATTTEIEDLEERFTSPGFDAANDSIIALNHDGVAVAYGEAYMEASGEAVVTVHVNGQVHPEWRRRGIGTKLLRWQEARGVQHLAASDLRLPGILSTLLGEHAVGQRALFEAEGFTPTRWWHEMERELTQALPAIDLGPGLRIDNYGPRWSEQARATINDAFKDHWGSQPTSRQEWETSQRSEDFRADWSSVALAVLPDGTERLVGAVTVEADEDEWESYGYHFGDIDELGVLREWRGRGIARALLTSSMRKMRDAGMARATLDVDGESPTGARSLYEKIGFLETARSITYTKQY